MATLGANVGARGANDWWTPTWSDEFSGAAISTADWTLWQPSTPGPYNNERQEYLPSQVTVSGGNLVITAVNQPYSSQYGNYSFRSGRVESKFAQQYGRWEIRARLPGTKGTWPALWLLPDAGQSPWPTQGEIDILENRGHEPTLTSSAFHFDGNPGSGTQHLYVTDAQTMARFGQPVQFHNEWHTYAVEWDATKLRLFVDDVHWYTVYNQGAYAGEEGTTVNGFLGSQTAPMETILNLAVGGDFLGSGNQPDASSVWPQQLLVDYVRVFERNEAAIQLANGGFDDAEGSLADWTVFGNRESTNNVSIHNEAAHGAASLKLFGQFANGATTSGASQGITVAAGDTVRAEASRFIRSQDSIAGTQNRVDMKIEFFNEFGGRTALQTATELIANSSSTNNAWENFDLTAVAPAGAVEARLSFVFSQAASGARGGAVHVDDVSFVNERLAAAADFNLDGAVDVDDLTLWKTGFGVESGASRGDGDANGDGRVDGADFLTWQQQVASAGAGFNAVPEPRAGWLAALASFLGGRGWRR